MIVAFRGGDEFAVVLLPLLGKPLRKRQDACCQQNLNSLPSGQRLESPAGRRQSVRSMANLPFQWGGVGISDFYQVRAAADYAGDFYHYGSVSAPGPQSHTDALPASFAPDGMDLPRRPVFRFHCCDAQPGGSNQFV